MYYTIAIDGPSGAGKSTTAKALATRLGLAHLDTGAMYRALAAALRKDGIAPSDEEEVLKVLNNYSLDVQFGNSGQRTLVNDRDMTEFLYTSENAQAASDVSRYSAVRRYLVEEQRKLAESKSFILDGRDIGTVVLPQANFKFFLTASPEIRAERRLKDLLAQGEEIGFDEVLADILKRDRQDSSRDDSPLKQAEDAILIDSSNLTFDEVLNTMLEEIMKVLG